MIVKSYVGGHDIIVFAGAVFDPAVRKYRGGHKIVCIPYCGKMLNVITENQESEPIIAGGVEIPTEKLVIVDADEIPEDSDFCIVSALYVAACKQLGRDTSRLLTVGGSVVDEGGQIIGCTGFYRN